MKSTLEGRSELKYALPVAMRGQVLAAAAAWIEPGAHAHSLADAPELHWDRRDPPPIGYRVHSLYLDSLLLDGYARRLAEADIRNRQRIRTYGRPGDDAPVFLEAKRKLHDRVVKHRVPVGRAHAWARGDPNHPWRDAVKRIHGGRDRRLAERWLNTTEQQQLSPVCVTHYTREVYEQGTARLTLDHAVMASAGGDPSHIHRQGQVMLLPPDWMVLELKFNGLEPTWMRGVVRQLRLCAEAVSKFALGVCRTVREDRALELNYLTPYSIRHAGQGFLAHPQHDAELLAGVAR